MNVNEYVGDDEPFEIKLNNMIMSYLLKRRLDYNNT